MRQASQIAIEPHSWTRSTEDLSESVKPDFPISNQMGRDARCRSAECGKCAGGSDKAALPESWHVCMVVHIFVS
jgi:hypothetical protein